MLTKHQEFQLVPNLRDDGFHLAACSSAVGDHTTQPLNQLDRVLQETASQRILTSIHEGLLYMRGCHRLWQDQHCIAEGVKAVPLERSPPHTD